MMNLVSLSAKHGGQLHPLVVNPNLTKGLSLLNPSIVQLSQGRYLILVRLTNFILPPEFSEHTRVHKQLKIGDSNINFRSEALALVLNNRLQIESESKVGIIEGESLWFYEGIEDIRLAVWNNRVYASGTRRDFQSDGKGRIEVLELSSDLNQRTWKEISKTIPNLVANELSFLEKNWMPVSDKPFTYVRWVIPTNVIEIVEWSSGYSEMTQRSLGGKSQGIELRGGTQLVRWGDGYLSIVHQSIAQKSYLGAISLTYQHRLVVWSKDLEVLRITDTPFGAMAGQVEFFSGLAPYKNGLLLTFGFQDSCAFMLELPYDAVQELIHLS